MEATRSDEATNVARVLDDDKGPRAGERARLRGVRRRGSGRGGEGGDPAPGRGARGGGDAGGYRRLPQVGSPPSALRELLALRDAPPNKQEELFKLKLQLCGVIFLFDDPTSDMRGKVRSVAWYFLCT